MRVPDTKVAEIISGELIVSPRPAIPHAICASGLGEELGPPFKRGRGGPGGWWILDEPELHLSRHILVPDLAGWRRERMLVCPDKQTLEVYRLEQGRWVLVGAYEGDAEVRAEPFDAIALNLAILWDRGQPPESKVEP